MLELQQDKPLALDNGVKTRVLLVDDNEDILETVTLFLEESDFEVVTATSVNEALTLIGRETFDVLLSDLHMPNPGDGLTVVSAMRHRNANAVTLIFSAYPEMKAAAAALVQQADDILMKPLPVDMLVKTIRQRLKMRSTPRRIVESVADILHNETQSTIEDWLGRVRQDEKLVPVPLPDQERCAHLPQLFHDLVWRLRHPLELGTRALVSPAAAWHGTMRRKQGYSAAMMVEESRMLQVSIFQTLQNNLHHVDYSILLLGVMTIADEVDSQLAQQMASFVAASKTDALRIVA